MQNVNCEMCLNIYIHGVVVSLMDIASINRYLSRKRGFQFRQENKKNTHRNEFLNSQVEAKRTSGNYNEFPHSMRAWLVIFHILCSKTHRVFLLFAVLKTFVNLWVPDYNIEYCTAAVIVQIKTRDFSREGMKYTFGHYNFNSVTFGERRVMLLCCCFIKVGLKPHELVG